MKKKLFLTQTINPKEKDYLQITSPEKIIPSKEKQNIELDSSSNSDLVNISQSTKADLMLNNSRKYSLIALSTDNTFSFNISHNSDLDNKTEDIIEKKHFLGKKTKFYFNIKKEGSNTNNYKKFFFTIKNSHKDKDDNQTLSLDESKSKSKNKSNKKKSNEKNININEGRWSLDEKKKFIEAFIQNGKKWKLIQNNINTRTCAQTRSHAQKFFLKLKSIDNKEFNFKKESIKDLEDVLNEIKNNIKIKNNGDYNDNNYIINILMELSEINVNEEKNKKFEKYKENNDKKENNNEINFENLNLNSNLEQNILNNNDKNLNDNNLNNNKNDINNNENKKDITNQEVNHNNEQKLNYINNNDDLNECYNCNNYSEASNQKLFFDDGYAFYINKDSMFYINNNSYYIREYNFNKNVEKSKYINTNFFS